MSGGCLYPPDQQPEVGRGARQRVTENRRHRVIKGLGCQRIPDRRAGQGTTLGASRQAASSPCHRGSQWNRNDTRSLGVTISSFSCHRKQVLPPSPPLHYTRPPEQHHSNWAGGAVPRGPGDDRPVGDERGGDGRQGPAGVFRGQDAEFLRIPTLSPEYPHILPLATDFGTISAGVSYPVPGTPSELRPPVPGTPNKSTTSPAGHSCAYSLTWNSGRLSRYNSGRCP